MKKINKVKYHLMLVVVLLSGMVSCKKNDTENGQLVGTKGTPTISSVRTISKSTVDSTRTSVYHYYTSKGTDSTVTVQNLNPQISAFDSTTVNGNIGNYYAAIGEHLGSATKITLNGVNVPFNRALSSDNSVIFTIPSNTPYVQPQSNSLVITTLYGTVTYGFTTLPPPPAISRTSEYNFTAGSQLTLKGRGFSAVTAVALRQSNETLTIVSKVDSQLVIKMPTASAATRSTLLFTYTAGSKAQQTASTIEFINIDKQYQIFANGALQNGWYDNSWTHPSGPTPSAPSVLSGLGSFAANFPAGGWQIEGFGSSTGIAYDASYKYLTFWVKGGTANHTLVLVGDKLKGGDSQNTAGYAAQQISVPKGVWTYYKIPLTNTTSSASSTSLNLWELGSPLTTLRFFLQGQSGDVNEVFYFDEVMLVK